MQGVSSEEECDVSVVYGRPIVLSTGSGGGYIVSQTAPEKTNVLWIQPNGLTHFWDGEQWVAIAGVYAEEETQT